MEASFCNLIFEILLNDNVLYHDFLFELEMISILTVASLQIVNGFVFRYLVHLIIRDCVAPEKYTKNDGLSQDLQASLT